MTEFTCLWHATTPMRVQSILANGLDPAFCENAASLGKGTYFTADAQNALGYEARRPEEGEVVLLSVNMEDLDLSQLGPDSVDLADILEQAGDNRHWSEVGWEESLILSGQCRYDALILPDKITLHANPEPQ